jgi:thiamine pyrophosphokinase
MTDEIVVVVAGGAPPDPEAARAVPSGARVVAADRGLDHALALGLEVAVAVGDFDSASPEAVAAAERAGALVERHPAAKDATDLELALDTALTFGPSRVLVLAGGGERVDHLLSALLLLGADRYASVQLDARIGGSRVHVVRGERQLEGAPGELVSLLPVGGTAEGVTTVGLAYPLAGETLEAGSSRGVSNRFEQKSAHVSVEQGTLLAVGPGTDAEDSK